MSLNRPGALDRLLLASPTGSFPYGGTYTTNFSGTENPLEEKSKWILGGRDGLDWSNIRTTTNLAYGTQAGNTGPPYDDSVALLTGVWGADQTVTATVKTTNQNSTAFCEVELWVRACIGPHWLTGYETNFRCTHDGSQYLGIVRWNGPLNQYTQIVANVNSPTNPGLLDGDTIKVTMIGNTITAYINAASIASFDVTTAAANPYGPVAYTSGNPGFGHWYRINGAVGTAASDFGLSSFTVTS